MMPPSGTPGSRDASPGAWSSRSGPYGPYGSEQPPPAGPPFVGDQRPAKRSASEVAAGAALTVEQRLDELERRQANLGSFREDMVSQMQATDAKLSFLHDQDEATRKEIMALWSKLQAVDTSSNSHCWLGKNPHLRWALVLVFFFWPTVLELKLVGWLSLPISESASAHALTEGEAARSAAVVSSSKVALVNPPRPSGAISDESSLTVP